MAAPTFVAEYESAWDNNNRPKTASVTVAAGDVLVIIAAVEDSSQTLSTPTGGSLTYTLRQSITTANYSAVYVWTAPAPTSQTFTLSIDASSTTLWWGFNCLRFSGSTGIGASSSTTSASGAPSLGITTTSANSAIVAVNSDWNALSGSSRTWRTVNSITPTSGNGLEVTYYHSNVHYTVYGAYWSDVGTAGSKTVGLSAPTGQKYGICAVEVLGTTGSGATVTPAAIGVVASLPVPALSTGSTIAATAVAAAAGMSTAAPGSGSTVAAGAIAGVVVTPAATVGAGSTALPDAVACAVSLPAAVLASGSTIQPAAVAAAASLPAAAVSTGATVTAAAVLASAALPGPSVSAGGSAAVSPSVVACAVSLPAPVLSAGVAVLPATVAGSVVVPAVTLTTDVVLTPAALLALVVVPAVAVSTEQAQGAGPTIVSSAPVGRSSASTAGRIISTTPRGRL